MRTILREREGGGGRYHHFTLDHVSLVSVMIYDLSPFYVILRISDISYYCFALLYEKDYTAQILCIMRMIVNIALTHRSDFISIKLVFEYPCVKEIKLL